MKAEMKPLINNRYSVLSLLGDGAQGAVYEVADRMFPDRRIALKLLGRSSPGILLRFEFSRLAQLDHPHLVKVYDLGIITTLEGSLSLSEGTAFFTQELIDGSAADTWSDTLRKKNRDLEIARVAVAVARALGLLHGRGLLHKDVKPSNILVSPLGDVIKLIDLGLSERIACLGGLRAGTLGYMAPEVQDGFAQERSDLFSLGATMAHMLTGQRPVHGDLNAGGTPREVTPALWSVVERLMKRRPKDRFSNAGEVVLALGRAMGSGVLGFDDGQDSGHETHLEILDAAGETEDKHTRASMVRSMEIIGRDKELESLSAWISTSLAGQDGVPGIAVVQGPTGVGKSRLVRAAAVRCQVRSIEEGIGPPVFIKGELRELVEAASRVAGGHLVSEGIEKWLAKGGSENGELSALDETLLREMAVLLVGVRQPSILFLENADLGWGPSLLHWLSEVEAGLACSPLGFIAESERGDLSSVVTGENEIKTIVLEPLSEEQEYELVAAVMGKPPVRRFVQDLHSYTGGIPLLTEATLAAIVSRRSVDDLDRADLADFDLPGDSERVIAVGLLSSLSEAGGALLKALAVLKGTTGVDQVIAVSGIADIETLRETVGELERRGISVKGGENDMRLSGFLSREVEEAMSGEERDVYHTAALAFLRGQPGVDPISIARHAVHSSGEKGVPDLIAAAVDRMKKLGDLRGAADQIEILLRLEGERVSSETLLDAARLLRKVGRYGRAMKIVEPFLKVSGVTGDRARLETGAALRLSGNPQEALELLRDLLDAGSPEVRMEALAISARIELDRGEIESASKLMEGASGGLGIPLETGLMATAGLVALARGESGKALEIFESGRALAGKEENSREQARFLALAGMVAHGRGSWGEAARRYSEALCIADGSGDAHGAATYAVNLAAALTELGEMREALSRYRDGLHRLRLVGRAGELVQAGSNYAQLLLRLGDTDGAFRASTNAVEDAQKENVSPHVKALALCVKGDVLVSSRRAAEALDPLMEAQSILTVGGNPKELRACCRHLAWVHLAMGQLDESERWDRECEATDEEIESSRLERLRFRLELAMSGRGSTLECLDRLVEELPEPENLVGIVHLAGLTSAARGARRLGKRDSATILARLALDTIARIKAATPALHRPSRSPTEIEMKMILDENGASVSGRVEGNLSDKWRWEKLVRINTRLNSELRISSLLDLIMDTALDVTDAKRGFLLVADSKGVLRVRCARNIDMDQLGEDRHNYSRSVAQRAFESGEPVVTTDAQEDPEFHSARSVMSLDLRYIIAVPLASMGKVTGTIYVDSRVGGRFDAARLEILAALADQAAIALTNARLTSENQRRQRRIETLNTQLMDRLKDREKDLEETRQNLESRTEALSSRYRYADIIGRSEEMRAVFRLLDRITNTDMPVVIGGESGTGKELVAKAIHYNGPRAKNPFVAENCAAIPAALLESILFGHKRGAFTGAARDNKGLFVQANGGTLFLDEIGNMPLEMQAKLLRVLQEGEVRPVGGSGTAKVDVRVVAASNSDLAGMVKERRFREDLFYRLNVVEVRLPPLRERVQDIPLLVQHFVGKHGGDSPPSVSRQVIEFLMAYRWPGNIRQLENEIMRALVLCDDVMEIEHLSGVILEGSSFSMEDPTDLAMEKQVERLKKRLIRRALEKTQGKRSKAAQILGISRYGLQKMMTRMGM